MSGTVIPKISCKCGRRHQAYWISQAGVQYGCRIAAAMDSDAELRSASGIARLAKEHRTEAEARLAWAAQQPEGPRRDRHMRVAQEEFAKAYELES